MKRRHFLTISAGSLASSQLRAQTSATAAKRVDNWHRTNDRLWLGGEFWANPMEDWCVKDGWATCKTDALNRNIHSTTRQITDPSKGFSMSVEIARPENLKSDAGAGFRLGILSEIKDHRADCFTQEGYEASILGDQLVLGTPRVKRGRGAINVDQVRNKLTASSKGQNVRLTLTGLPGGDKVKLTLSVADPKSGKELGSVSGEVPAAKLIGNIALVSQLPPEDYKTSTSPKSDDRPGSHENPGYQFRDWQIGGDGITYDADRKFGPILWSMYSLNDSRGDEGFVLTLSALTGPMGEKDNKQVELEVQKDGKWEKVADATLDPDAWTATFRLPNWDEKAAKPFRVVYREKHSDGSETPDYWDGTIRANPVGRPLNIGGLTCQEHSGFPYKPVADNLIKLDLDLLFFSGDQLYEQNGGYGIIRKPATTAIHCYLRKFYMFGWAFREPMRHAPTLCLPDDHDVFQGNFWGEGGAPSGTNGGGYTEPARMVNAVHRTNCSHHPKPYDAKPSLQDISVYYGDMVYGGVSFAIIADRQWKSGPKKANPNGEKLDRKNNPKYDPKSIDQPGLILLGERQEEFLKKWADDWRGHTMKIVMSQTVFSSLATNTGGKFGVVNVDLDSGGWPQTPRNNAVEIMRSAMALHLCGDQHMASFSQYGVDKQRDGNWAFCTPAISVGYPRWWLPDQNDIPHKNRPSHGLPNTGEYVEWLGNKAYVYAVGNPSRERQASETRYDNSHKKASGFGVVRVDTKAKTYTMESYRFNVDVTDGKPENQFPGWPVTIHQKENKGENILEA